LLSLYAAVSERTMGILAVHVRTMGHAEAVCRLFTMPENWIEHRRGLDGERLGWMKPVGDGFIVIDLLGREKTGVVDWFDAEETLDDLGIGYLADAYELRLDTGARLRVRVAEVSAQEIRVKKDDWGDMSAPQLFYTLPFPAPDALRPLHRK
jgi:hypothetical protein